MKTSWGRNEACALPHLPLASNITSYLDQQIHPREEKYLMQEEEALLGQWLFLGS